MKHRLIADCRELNQFCSPEKFTLETMQTIYPLLKKGWFCAKLDLKDAVYGVPGWWRTHPARCGELRPQELRWGGAEPSQFLVRRIDGLVFEVLEPAEKLLEGKNNQLMDPGEQVQDADEGYPSRVAQNEATNESRHYKIPPIRPQL